jgi:hypothetical protein
MTRDQIDSALAGLAVHEDGWTTPISASFLGRPMRLQVSTAPIKKADPPHPDAEQLALIHKVLGAIEDVVAKAEAAGTKELADGVDHVADPHVWIWFEQYDEEGTERWSLVVGDDRAPDYATNFEFNGLEFLGTSAGD